MHEVCMDSCNSMVCCAVVYDALVACTCMCMCASLHWQTALSVLVAYTQMSSATGMDHLPGMFSYKNEHRACQITLNKLV